MWQKNEQMAEFLISNGAHIDAKNDKKQVCIGVCYLKIVNAYTNASLPPHYPVAKIQLFYHFSHTYHPNQLIYLLIDFIKEYQYIYSTPRRRPHSTGRPAAVSSPL